MENKVFAYVRVSTAEQNEARQLEEVRKYVAEERDIFIDKVSGKDFNRTAYQTLKGNLREGDLVIIKSLDRLGRNYTEVLNEWREITATLKCNIKVLDIEILDTSKSSDGLTGRFISDLVLQILAYVAENERVNIRQRQAEGIAVAKKNGARFGRPRVEKPDNWGEVYALWQSKRITAVEAMKRLGLKPNTFYKFANDG